MKKLLTFIIAGLFACSTIVFAETYEEFQKNKGKDESVQRLIPKGKPRLKTKDIIVEELRTQGETAFDSDLINFDYGSPRLRETAKPQLLEIAKSITTSQDLAKIPFFYVDGHTCSIGSQENNCRLSWGRAGSVVEFLTTVGGVPREKIRARGFGLSMPKHSNETEDGRSMNRRVVLRTPHQASESDNKLVCHQIAAPQQWSSDPGYEYGFGSSQSWLSEWTDQTDEDVAVMIERGKKAGPSGFNRIPTSQGSPGGSDPKSIKPVKEAAPPPKGFQKSN